MNCRLIISLTCLAAVILFIGCNKKEIPLTELRSELDSLEQHMEWLDYRLTAERWAKDKTGRSDSLAFYEDLFRVVLANSSLMRNVPANYNRLNDRTDRYRYRLLLGKTLPERVEMTPRITGLRDSLLREVRDSRIDFRGESLSLNEVENIYRNSRNRSERELAYRAAYGPGEVLEKSLKDLIIMRNEEAVRLGFANHFELICSYSSMTPDDYLSLFRRIDSLTQTANTEISDKVRKAVGVNQLEIWDMPYAYSQINQRTDTFFPDDLQLNFVETGLLRMGFDLKNLPIYHEEMSVENTYAETETYSVKAPTDLRILSRTTSGFRNTHSLLREFGKALYQVHIAEARPLHNFAIESIWREAMGEITATIVCDSLWLNDVVNMPVGFIAQFRQAKSEQELIYIRQLVMKLHFQFEAYLNPRRDLSNLYWELLQKYTGLPRHQDIPVWTSQMEFITEPMHSLNLLLAKLIAAQSVNYMHGYLSKTANNSNTSSFLIQNYYRFGSRYSWPELLQRGTGEKLDPRYLISLLDIMKEN